jgi:hypothetical protein
MHSRRWIVPYLLLFSAIALLHSLSELQAYHHSGGTRDWEPFLWEFSSVICVALLTLGIYRLVKHMEGRPWPQQAAMHFLGYVLFSSLHVAGMFGIRFAVYGLLGQEYAPGPWRQLLLYEGGKDAVSYLTLVLVLQGFRAWRAGLARQQELERTRRELAEAQAARLADQVQPHFLFNSLNLIASVMHEDVARADTLLCDLASLLRQTTQAQQVVEHSLADELLLVQPFLSLMQARFGAERLRVELQISDAAKAFRLPALLLLGPVENAIKHDVAQHSGPVTVRLQAEVVAGRLRLRLPVYAGLVVPHAGSRGVLGRSATPAPAAVVGGAAVLAEYCQLLPLSRPIGVATHVDLRATRTVGHDGLVGHWCGLRYGETVGAT